MLNEKCLIVKNSVLEQYYGDYIYIIPIKDAIADMENVICLSGISKFIWDLIGKKTTLKNLIDFVIIDYEVDKETVTKDINDFLMALINEKVIDVIDND